MNKKTKYTINGAVIGGLSFGAYYALKQWDSNEEFNWLEFFKSLFKGALIGGSAGFGIGYLRDKQMTMALLYAGGIAGYLNEVLANNEFEDDILLRKSKWIQKALYDEFNSCLSEYPSLNGSVVKGTSISGSDIDIHVKFNRHSDTIPNLYDKVFTFFNEGFNDTKIDKVRMQTHSVGLFFKYEDELKRIDIIPSREIENEQGDTYLHVNSNYLFNKSTIKKTNAFKQKSVLRFSEKQKKIVKLLKTLKLENSLNIKSIFLEFIVKRAFAETRMPIDIDKCFLKVIEFLGENITTIVIIDPANTNNIISDSLTFYEKEIIQVFCFKMLDDISKNERTIIDYISLTD